MTRLRNVVVCCEYSSSKVLGGPLRREVLAWDHSRNPSGIPCRKQKLPKLQYPIPFGAQQATATYWDEDQQFKLRRVANNPFVRGLIGPKPETDGIRLVTTDALENAVMTVVCWANPT